MDKNKKIGIAIGVGVIIVVAAIIFAQPKKVQHTYTPATDLTQIRECVEKITGDPKLDIEALTQDQALFADVYRFCLKTVEDIETTLKALAQ